MARKERIEKGIARGADYFMLRRVAIALGKNGPKVVDAALNGDEKALDRIEDYAFRNVKKPAVVRWVDAQRAKIERKKKAEAKANAKALAG